MHSIVYCISICADAIMSFLRDTPFTTGLTSLDGVATAIAIGALSVVPDMGYLSKASAAGLFVLALTFVVIAFYGEATLEGYNMLPEDGLNGVSHWFGCTVFGFGVVPMTYNYRESMSEPTLMVQASTIALMGVAVGYIIIGSGLLVLYPNVEGDILQELPVTGMFPTIVRLSMVLVVMATSPLLVLPCGELIEEKLTAWFGLSAEPTSRRKLQAVTRISICLVCTGIAIGVPSFVYVLSFVGCFSVATVGFIVPPLLHLYLVPRWLDQRRDVILDLLLLSWGVVATGISAVYTFRQLFNQ